jgi:pyruvate dehydrogenase E2 component (dihydrolipoamide acetyltransferase)
MKPQAAPSAPAKTAAPVPVLATRTASGQKEVIPLTKIRDVIAKRLQQSKQNIPHFYETIDIDAEELTKLRERMNKALEKTGVRVSVGDFVAKAVATALLQHRHLNAHFNGTEITTFPDVNLGMAVALPNGLIVPVLRNINQMGLAEIRVRSADLVDRAREQKLKQDELTGATFTVSNLGTYGVREFSAIINPPEVGILAIGGAEKRAVVKNDQLVARTMMTVTLSADHRVVDGAAAAEFLRTLKALLEEPGMMLV